MGVVWRRFQRETAERAAMHGHKLSDFQGVTWKSNIGYVSKKALCLYCHAELTATFCMEHGFRADNEFFEQSCPQAATLP
jgi:hypothetical protein